MQYDDPFYCNIIHEFSLSFFLISILRNELRMRKKG